MVDLMFDVARKAEARAVCQDCPVRLDCLAHAVSSGERFGVWGGQDPAGREAIAKECAHALRLADRTAQGDRGAPLAVSIVPPVRMLSAGEVARQLDVTEVTVRRWVHRGQLPAVVLPSSPKRSLIRIDPADVARFVAGAQPVLSQATVELLRHLAKAADTCPQCASRPVDGGSPWSWCDPCTTERAKAQEAAEERERTRKLDYWHSPAGREANARRNAARRKGPQQEATA